MGKSEWRCDLNRHRSTRNVSICCVNLYFTLSFYICISVRAVSVVTSVKEVMFSSPSFVYLVCLLVGLLKKKTILFVCPHSFMFPWAVESSRLQFLALA